MKNKVLIKLWIPELDVYYDVFIPVNEVMWKVKILLLKSVEDILKISINNNIDYYLVNKDTCKIYDSNEIVLNTDIRNGSEILLISIKDKK
ncbi:MAG: hypothetical protein IJY87_03965 [Bacilli bacterium]|nr:hypothetical protein [Bacilli bacterium]MBQ8902207.1 hypothetical protein [Bacilli bacterium]